MRYLCLLTTTRRIAISTTEQSFLQRTERSAFCRVSILELYFSVVSKDSDFCGVYSAGSIYNSNILELFYFNMDQSIESPKIQSLSESCFFATNKLANLYLNAIYVYGFICEILEQDPPLESVFESFRQKHEKARVCSQKIVDFLFCRGKAFQLLEPFRLTSLDCNRGTALDAEIKQLLGDLQNLAVDIKDVHLINFVKTLIDTDENEKKKVENSISQGSTNSESDQLVSIKFEEYVQAQGTAELDNYSEIQESLLVAEWKSVKEREKQIENAFDQRTLDQVAKNDGEGSLKFSGPDGKPKKILFAVRPNLRSEVMARINQIFQWLQDVYPDIQISLLEDKAEVDKETDLVVIVGGDGTLLRTAAFFGDDVPPVLGFRAGNLNYLLHYDLNDDFSLIFQSIFDGDASTTMRSCLSCNLHMANDTGKTYTAVNEVCLHRGNNPQTVAVEVTVDGNEVLSIEGDGVLISTSTGSTAYCLSAGGAVVHPDVQCFQVVPICPVNIFNHSIVLPSTSKVQFKVKRGSAHLNTDTECLHILQVGDYLEIMANRIPLRLIYDSRQPGSTLHWLKALRSKCRYSGSDNACSR